MQRTNNTLIATTIEPSLAKQDERGGNGCCGMLLKHPPTVPMFYRCGMLRHAAYCWCLDVGKEPWDLGATGLTKLEDKT